MFNKALNHGLTKWGPYTASPCVGPYPINPAPAMGFYPTGNVFIGHDSLAITPEFQHNMDNGEELIIC